MDNRFDLKEMADQIRLLRTAAEKLNRMGENFPALEKNTVRILAGVKMLELNISDLVTLSDPD